MNSIYSGKFNKKRLSDTITPVGLYVRLRDRYSNLLLLESSDYHSKEESFSFLCIEPLVSIYAQDHNLILEQGQRQIEKQPIGRNFNTLFEQFSKYIQVDCDDEFKPFNGLYGYTTYDAVQYFENIKL